MEKENNILNIYKFYVEKKSSVLLNHFDFFLYDD